MSLYKPKNSPYYQFDFELGGHRFSGTTKCTSRREAEAVERTEKERAKRRVADLRNTSIRLDLDSVIDRFWIESGQHFSGASDTWRDLGRLIDFFGATRLITEIRDDDIAKLVAGCYSIVPRGTGASDFNMSRSGRIICCHSHKNGFANWWVMKVRGWKRRLVKTCGPSSISLPSRDCGRRKDIHCAGWK